MARRTVVPVIGLLIGLVTLPVTAACGRHPSVADCRSPHLHWRLTRLSERAPGAPAALLSGTNTGARPCAFDGYPQLDVRVGKAQGVRSEPREKGEPARLVVEPGRTVDVPLFYRPDGGAPGSCWIAGGYNASSRVVPPHATGDDDGSPVHFTDAGGHRLPTQVCSDTLRMGPPRLR
ncbi:DUF4232 domain-containing protein [Streptomyces actuosus]|uniref:DUF4232 domain-containing protein n=1 Tax=Streptomyces actuosus TaxID=1885 RepID=A0ABS2W042_STRAS|nr:DUF4232 domain-containing protein [Streptomyces actuosus]MBN0048772.1 DUF4232 domain-containing protein [Streptomyces actuosus]